MTLKSLVLFQDVTAVSGGRERICLEGLRIIQERGVRVRLVTYYHDAASVFEGRYAPEIVAMSRGPASETPRSIFDPGPAAPSLKAIREWGARIAWLRRELHAIKPDIILTDGEGSSVVDAYLATRFTPYRYAAIVYGSLAAFCSLFVRSLVFRKSFDDILRSVEGYRKAEEVRTAPHSASARLSLEAIARLRLLAVRAADRLFVFSEQMAWEVSRMYGRTPAVFKGAFPERIFLHQSAKDIRKELGLEGRRVILSVGRLHPKKRVDLCLKAFKKLKSELPDAFLLIAGVGGEEAALKSQVGDLGLSQDVRFAGFVPDGDLWDYYRSCDLFVNLDCTDFDVAPYEALALGCNVVWTDEMAMEGLAGHPLIFPCRPTADGTARAMASALRSGPAGPQAQSALRPYTYESYFGRMLQELAACRTAG